MWSAIYDEENRPLSDIMRTSIDQIMTANLQLAKNPEQPMDAATKEYVDLHEENLILHTGSGITTGTDSAFRVSIPDFKLQDGETIRIKLHTDMTGAATLNVNDTGAIPILYSNGKPIKGGAITDSYITLTYNGANFIIQGDGGNADSERSTWQRLLTNTMNVRGW